MKKAVAPKDLPCFQTVYETRSVTKFHSLAEAQAALASGLLNEATETTQDKWVEQWQEASKESGMPGVWKTAEEKK